MLTNEQEIKKAWLERAEGIATYIMSLEEQHRTALEMATRTTGSMSVDKVQETQKNSTEDKFIAYIDYAALINKEKAKMFKIQAEISKAIYQIDDIKIKTILNDKHINGRKTKEIADDMGYSEAHIKNILYPKALDELKI